MTESEAIKELDYFRRIFDDEGRYKACDALVMAIKALEKQIPKKPNKAIDTSWGVHKEVNVCPVCDSFLTEVHFIDCDETKEGKRISYCETCGQAIDWE